MGLRELKKEQTRQLIAGTAWRLFAVRKLTAEAFALLENGLAGYDVRA